MSIKLTNRKFNKLFKNTKLSAFTLDDIVDYAMCDLSDVKKGQPIIQYVGSFCIEENGVKKLLIQREFVNKNITSQHSVADNAYINLKLYQLGDKIYSNIVEFEDIINRKIEEKEYFNSIIQ